MRQAPQRRSPAVLVVDDEPMVVEVVGRYLAREGFSVSTASDGELALAAFRENRPHLVVLDLMLPKVGGMDVCREIRAVAPVPVIMLTARGDEMDRIAGFEVGADDYLAKPVGPDEIINAANAAVMHKKWALRSDTQERISMGRVAA